MPPVPADHETIVATLRVTRSVEATARNLGIPQADVQRVAWMAFGLGKLEVALVDF